MQSDETGQREKMSSMDPTALGANPRREKLSSEPRQNERETKKKQSRGTGGPGRPRRKFCLETKGSGAPVDGGAFGEVGEAALRRLPAPLLPQFETPYQPSPTVARVGEGAPLPPHTSGPCTPLPNAANTPASACPAPAPSPNTHNSPLPDFSQFFIHSAGTSTVAAAIFPSLVTVARMCGLRARGQRGAPPTGSDGSWEFGFRFPAPPTSPPSASPVPC